MSPVHHRHDSIRRGSFTDSPPTTGSDRTAHPASAKRTGTSVAGLALRAALGAAALVCLVLFSIGVFGADLRGAPGTPLGASSSIAGAQSASLTRYMPDIRTRGHVTPTFTPSPTPTPTPTVLAGMPADRGMGTAGSLAAPAGISGFGDSVVALQNVTDDPTSADLMISQRGRNRFDLGVGLDARGAFTMSLDEREGALAGFWHGIMRPGNAAEALVRSTWPLTATSAYRALAPDKSFFLPLAVRGLDRHYFTYYLQNADEDRERNTVTFQAFNDETGGLEYEWEEWLEPGDVVDVDSIESLTGPDFIPSNARDGGWIGGLRIRAQGDVALLVYGNEAQDGGVAAYSAQPVAHAAEIVHLPLIRANVFGDSLIAVGNPSDEAISARVIYRGAPDSPSGAGETFEHMFTIQPRTSRFVDFGEREWGTVPSHPLPVGSSRHLGFLGSARIEADADVLATVLESAVYVTRTRATAAYDGFTDADLGTAFAVPYLVHEPAAVSTHLILLNPGDAPVDVSAEWDLDMPGTGMPPSESVTVPAGEMRAIKTVGPTAFTGRAEIRSSGSIAVLVYETPFETAADFGPAGDMGYDTAAYAAPRLLGDVAPVPSPTTRSAPSPTFTAEPTAPPTGVPPETPTAIATPDPGVVTTIHMPMAFKNY